jgi:hypothetical protein
MHLISHRVNTIDDNRIEKSVDELVHLNMIEQKIWVKYAIVDAL